MASEDVDYNALTADELANLTDEQLNKVSAAVQKMMQTSKCGVLGSIYPNIVLQKLKSLQRSTWSQRSPKCLLAV